MLLGGLLLQLFLYFGRAALERQRRGLRDVDIDVLVPRIGLRVAIESEYFAVAARDHHRELVEVLAYALPGQGCGDVAGFLIAAKAEFFAADVLDAGVCLFVERIARCASRRDVGASGFRRRRLRLVAAGRSLRGLIDLHLIGDHPPACGVEVLLHRRLQRLLERADILDTDAPEVFLERGFVRTAGIVLAGQPGELAAVAHRVCVEAPEQIARIEIGMSLRIQGPLHAGDRLVGDPVVIGNASGLPAEDVGSTQQRTRVSLRHRVEQGSFPDQLLVLLGHALQLRAALHDLLRHFFRGDRVEQGAGLRPVVCADLSRLQPEQRGVVGQPILIDIRDESLRIACEVVAGPGVAGRIRVVRKIVVRELRGTDRNAAELGAQLAFGGGAQTVALLLGGRQCWRLRTKQVRLCKRGGVVRDAHPAALHDGCRSSISSVNRHVHAGRDDIRSETGWDAAYGDAVGHVSV